MPNYSIYNPLEGSRSTALDRMAAMARQRQAFTDSQYQKALEEQKKAEKAQADMQSEGSRNWLGSAVSMGGMGAMTGDPFIAGGAALAGAGMAIAGSYQDRQRRNKGEGKWASLGKAISHPMGDKFELSNDVMPLMGGAAMMAGGLNKGPPQMAAQQSQAQQLQAWRNQTASAGMANTAGAPMPGTGSLGQAYGQTYSARPYRPAQYGQAYGGLPSV